MSNCIVILHPRDIPPVMAAYAELPYDKLWLSRYTERELADGVFMAALREAGYDRYMICSDDILVRQGAVDRVVAALDAGHPVATGYSQRTHTEMVINLTSGPIRGPQPGPEAYDFLNLSDAVSKTEPLFRTWFAGFSITGMSMEMWEQFPFDCFGDPWEGGMASDFSLSLRLQKAGVPIMAVRDAFAYHWRNEWRTVNHPDDAGLLVGEQTAEVRLERA